MAIEQELNRKLFRDRELGIFEISIDNIISSSSSKSSDWESGYKYIEETKECVIEWVPTTAVEKYLPSINTVSTTFAITVVATTAATLTPLLNRVLKPLFKQLINRVKKLIGKKGTKFEGKKPIKSKLRKSS